MNSFTLGQHGMLGEADIKTVVNALSLNRKRVQKLELSSGTFWVKRYGHDRKTVWVSLHRSVSKFIPWLFLRASPTLSTDGMVEREVRRIGAFRAAGFPAPDIAFKSKTALVIADIGPSVMSVMGNLKQAGNAAAHDALLVKCAEALGKIHAAGLYHGRPHPRDFTLTDGDIGFLDFEEEACAVMPLATAQARDMVLLCLQISSRAFDQQATTQRCYEIWVEHAPEDAVREFADAVTTVKPLLPLASLINRMTRSSDVRRFVVAISTLLTVMP